MRSKRGICAATIMLGLAGMTAFALGQGNIGQQPAVDPQQQHQQEQRQQRAGQYAYTVAQLTQDWPEVSKQAAMAMQQKYGQPTGMAPNQIIWQDAGPWKEIIVRREPIDHDFPVPHQDVLEQVIDYDVPVDKFDELAAYDGSVIAERTRGTLSARCDKEAANFLALNLADDIVKGEKTVEEARQAYAESVKQMLAGQTPELMQQLQFEPPRKAGDTDVAVIERPVGQPGEARPAGERQPAQDDRGQQAQPRQQQQQQ